MTAELGVFFLVLALLSALLQAAFLWPNQQLKSALKASQQSASWLQLFCICLSFVILMTLRLDSDFSVLNVVSHSNLTLPTLYKIAGTWGNHEGSMLLFALVLAGYGTALISSRMADTGLKAQAVAIQAFISAGALIFILFTSNPFERRFPPAVDGQALNPILQDVALAMHPPLLYVGYVGFSIVFSLAVAALLQGRMDRNWAIAAHPWILAAWSALTLGIGLGSWWAYRVLGWGGWWFWDPVENASLLPWLAGTALLHSNIVCRKRGMLNGWVILLSIITFALSLLGTFLVRSGTLTSVHSFAHDPARGLFIIVYMLITIGGALLLFSLRAEKLQSPEIMRPVSREGIILINNLLLLTACATVLLGTVYPMIAESLSTQSFSVGAPYFNITFLPLMAISLLFAGLAPLLAWKKASLKEALVKARPALLAAGAAMVVVYAAVETKAALAALGFGLAGWLTFSSLQWLRQGTGNQRITVFLGHMGAAVLVMGITGVSLWKQDKEQWIKPGEVIEIGSYRALYRQESEERAANHAAKRGVFSLQDNYGDEIATLSPEWRTYDITGTQTSKVSIHAGAFGDIYAVIGESSPDGTRTAARLYYVPMIHFIWAGFVLMASSGLLAIAQRKMTA